MDAFIAMAYRQLKRFLRAKPRLVFTLITPIMWIVFYGIGWASSMNFPGIELILGTDYLSFLIPGVVGMAVFMAGYMSGVSVIWDKHFGFLKEVLVAPTPRWQSITGRIFGDSIVAMIQGVALALLGFLIAHNMNPWGLPIVFLASFLTAFGFASIGTAIAASGKFKTIEGFQAFVNLVTFPVIFSSGAFFPLNNVPDWFKSIAYVNPLTYSVDAMRLALAGVGSFPMWEDLLALVIFALTSGAIAAYFFERSTLD
ncbi:ABC transporter [Ignicoccus pacificus DSM 13166]|uniref:ABC transporter n=1 Tax=Ignicoccus pacificus DSM 13166 TaxID=940294 RepID=A0A977K917_9CREN|nr:ABC transporter [Ignicoccus pacificus DSM 13166]